jgi:hypothetical protein
MQANNQHSPNQPPPNRKASNNSGTTSKSLQATLESRKGPKTWRKGNIEEEETSVTEIARKKYKGSFLFWLLIIIYFGGLIALNAAGVINWDLWTVLWRFWPVLIVITLLRVILGRNLILNVLIVVISGIALFIATLWSLLIVQPEVLDLVGLTIPDQLKELILVGGEKKSEEFVLRGEDFSGIKRRSIRIDFEAAEFTIKDNDKSDYLLVDAEYFEGVGEPDLSSSQENDKLIVDFDTISRGIGLALPTEHPVYDFSIGKSEIPTHLTIANTAGRGEVELNDLTLETFLMDVGAGEATLDVSNIDCENLTAMVGQGQMTVNLRDVGLGDRIKLKVGAGRMKLRLPEDYGYSISYKLGMGSINSPAKDVKGSSRGTILSLNYEEARKTVGIDLDVGVGTFEIDY